MNKTQIHIIKALGGTVFVLKARLDKASATIEEGETRKLHIFSSLSCHSREIIFLEKLHDKVICQGSGEMSPTLFTFIQFDGSVVLCKPL